MRLLKLLNVSMTILGLSEGEQYNYPISLQDEEEVSTNKSFLVGKELVVMKALSHLSKQATHDLHAANRSLEEEKNKIQEEKNRQREEKRKLQAEKKKQPKGEKVQAPSLPPPPPPPPEK